MAMGAKFQSPLEFQGDGSLEVCGPVDFDPGDVMFEVVSFSITDGRGVTVNQVCVPHACADPGEMWESEIPGARAKKLTPGPGASGQGLGFMHLANGTTVQFPWTQTGLEIEQ